ncbi:hypothetical protein HanRHA438_Chr11g0518401 [Helianthus annuus]|nr:hypothetical protein HanRHA438_Chr11g0518401 [Helianthus annuus]
MEIRPNIVINFLGHLDLFFNRPILSQTHPNPATNPPILPPLDFSNHISKYS